MSGSEERRPRAADARPVGVFGGLTTLDVIHRSAAVPGPNEKLTAARQDVAAGGPAANAAVVFAALGGRARLVTALGSGAVAQIARADLERHGVDVVDVTPGSASELGVSAVRVDEATGDRSVLSMDAAGRVDAAGREALETLSGADCDGWVAGADVVLLDGHLPVLALALAGAARRAGVGVVVDAGRWREVMGDLLPMAGVIVASAEFRWRGAGGGTAPWLELAHADQAVTHGADPVQWWSGEAMGEVAVPVVDAVDTLGAGDAFHGAFAYWHALASRMHLSGSPGRDQHHARPSLPQQLAAAAEVAALRCSVVGPRDWLALLQRADVTAGAPAPGDPLSPRNR